MFQANNLIYFQYYNNNKKYISIPKYGCTASIKTLFTVITVDLKCNNVKKIQKSPMFLLDTICKKDYKTIFDCTIITYNLAICEEHFVIFRSITNNP